MNRVTRILGLLALGLLGFSIYYVVQSLRSSSPTSNTDIASNNLMPDFEEIRSVQAIMEDETKAEPTSGNAATSLYSAAQAEGVVNIWGANIDDLSWIPGAFSKEFPGVRVNVRSDFDIANRVKPMLENGNESVDIVWSSESLVQSLIDEHLLIGGDEWLRIGVRTEDIGADGHMAYTNSTAFAIAYRSDVVAKEDVPFLWDQLTEERYRGKLSASPVLMGHLCATLGYFEGELKWLEFAKKIGEESETHWTVNLEQSLLSGRSQYAVAISSHMAYSWQARGLPITVVLPEPVFVSQFGSVVPRNAPHPNAARLLASWLASPQGKAAREQALHAVDLRPSSTHPKAVELRQSRKRIYDDSQAAVTARAALLPKVQTVLSLTSRPPTVTPRPGRTP